MNNRNILSLCIGAVLFSSGAFASNVELSELYRDSLENNPALRAAAYEIESAQRQHDQINGLYRPQLDASIAYGALRNDWTTLTETDSHGAEVSVSAGQNLFNSELNASSRVAERGVKLTQVSYQVALESLKLNVALGYLSALKEQENLTQANASKQAIGEQLRQVENRFSNGLVPENDVKETQAQYDLAVAAVISTQNNFNQALDALYELTGKTYTSVSSLELDRASFQVPKGTAAQWQEKAQATNPQMLIQQQLVTLSREQISLAEAGHAPSLGLIAEYRYAFGSQSQHKTAAGDKSGFTDLDNNSTIFAGIAMNLPLYRGGATSNKVEQAKIQYQQSLQLQEQTWREVTRDIRSTQNDLIALQSTQNAYLQAVGSAESALLATEQGFEIGTRTIVDVLNSTSQLYQARQQLSASQIDFILASLKLKFLTGELSEQDLFDVSSLSVEAAG